MIDDLNGVSVRIEQIKGPGPVPMRAWSRLEGYAVRVEIGGPTINVIRLPNEQAEMIEPTRRDRTIRTGSVQRKVVGARREVYVIHVRLPLDRKTQPVDVEAFHLLERPRKERQMP